MSRTYHHSERWGRDHLWADRPDRHPYKSAPGWWINLLMNRPGHRNDARVLKLIANGWIDVEEATFSRTGGRKLHEYYW